MNGDDFVKKAMEQAKEMQHKVADALGDTDKLRAEMVEQSKRAADATHEQTKAAIDSIESAVKAGSEQIQKLLRRDG
ncbi:MAG: hypothetical protein KGN02_10105 [bacterium]|nr:hypothetical protein [bacterium]